MSAGNQKKKKFFDIKPPDMFMLSYASLATLLLAFFIVLNTFTEEKKKEFIEEFRESMKRREISFGLGGILPDRRDDGEKDTYELMKFVRTNQGTCINQRPVVAKGDRVEKGELLADTSATEMGELALGQNVT